jgi:hypothetical protein
VTQDELNRLTVGRVIRHVGSGTLRVVRDVARTERNKRKLKAGDVFAISCVIKHCSWTRRPLTTLDRYTLRSQYELTNVRVRLDTELDAKLALEAQFRVDGRDPAITCCTVEGLP